MFASIDAFYVSPGSRLWRYTNFQLDKGFPRTIATDDFPDSVFAVTTMKDGQGNTMVIMFGVNIPVTQPLNTQIRLFQKLYEITYQVLFGYLRNMFYTRPWF